MSTPPVIISRHFGFFADNLSMEIESLSTNMSQGRVQEEAAVKVEAMMLKTIKDAGADLARIMDSAKMISDPAKGNYLNLFM